MEFSWQEYRSGLPDKEHLNINFSLPLLGTDLPSSVHYAFVSWVNQTNTSSTIKINFSSGTSHATPLKRTFLSQSSKGLITRGWLSCTCRHLWWNQMVKNSSAMQETQVWPLGWEDPLEKEMATHSSILAWRIPRGAWRAMVHGVARNNWVTNTFTFVYEASILFLLKIAIDVKQTGQMTWGNTGLHLMKVFSLNTYWCPY